MPSSVTSIGYEAFHACSSLRGIYFQGNAPSVFPDGLAGAENATVYFLTDTTGWEATFGGRPALLWNPVMQTGDSSFGVGPGGFGFNITGTAEIPVVVEAATNLVSGDWVSLQSLTLTNSSVYFSDPDWVNFPTRHYRIRSP